MKDAQMMIASGWEPIEYASPFEVDGGQVYIQWNGIYGQWVVLDHPTVDGDSRFPTASAAMLAIDHAAKN